MKSINRSISKLTTMSVFIQFWCFKTFWNLETKSITLGTNLRQSGQVRLSPEDCFAVLIHFQIWKKNHFGFRNQF